MAPKHFCLITMKPFYGKHLNTFVLFLCFVLFVFADISDNNETFLWHLNSFVSTLPNETFPIPAFLQSCESDNSRTNIFGFSKVVFFHDICHFFTLTHFEA